MKYRFDEYELAVDAYELRNAAGLVAIEPQVFSLLVYLIENNERVVSKDELIEAIWEGRFVSDAAVSSRIKSARRALGDDGQAQKFIKTYHGRGVRFIANVTPIGANKSDGARPNANSAHSSGVNAYQDIRFCESADKTRIAYASAGAGPPLIKTANWLNHLEYDWQSPVWSHFFSDLMNRRQLIRYDARGNGLSDWNVDDFSLARQVEDLEAVVDAAGIDRFPLLGLSQGCTVSAVYAAKHPERVTKLVLLGGYAAGWRVRSSEKSISETEAMCTLIRSGWGRNHPAFRQMFTSLFMPDAPPENQEWFNELQRMTTSPENAAKLLEALGDVDAREHLPKVQAPTLVIHCRGDLRVPMSAGRELASGIPNARFMTLESNNHIIPVTDPAWAQFSTAMQQFLDE